MRLIPLLTVAVALVFAGCAKEDPPATSTPAGTTTATGTTTTTTTPTGTTTPTTTTPTTPTKPAPLEAAKGTADFSQNTPAQPLPAKPFTIPAGYTTGNLTVTWACTGGAPQCITGTVEVKAGGLTCSLAAGPYGTSGAPAPCVKEGAAPPGDYKVEFVGEGLIVASYTFTAT